MIRRLIVRIKARFGYYPRLIADRKAYNDRNPFITAEMLEKALYLPSRDQEQMSKDANKIRKLEAKIEKIRGRHLGD